MQAIVAFALAAFAPAVCGHVSNADEGNGAPRPEGPRSFAEFTVHAIPARSEHFALWAAPGTDAASNGDAYLARLEAALGRMQTALDPSGKRRPFEGAQIRVRVYAHPEDLLTLTKRASASQVIAEENTIDVVEGGGVRGDATGAFAVLALTRILSKHFSTALLEGVDVAWSSSWQGRDWRAEAGRLYRSGVANDLKRIAKQPPPNGSGRSLLLEGPALGVLAEVAMNSAAQSADPVSALTAFRPEEHLAEWQAALEAIPTPVSTPNQGAPPPRQAGYCFAHEGYAVVDGYASREAERMLAEIASQGATWVSITPFGFCRQDDPAVFAPFDGPPGAENDVAVIHAIQAAHAAGLRVLLKPHLWLSRGWIGDFGPRNPRDWEVFFQNYRRFLLHFAELADLYRVDALCVGTEMVHAALDRPDDWRKIIADVRGIYAGPLTYAANWGYEFENLSFWDALDWIGLDEYYPLSDDPHANFAALQAGARGVSRKIGAVAARWGKPVVLTEIGFPACEASWESPHDGSGGRAGRVGFQAQADCFRAAIEEFSAQTWWLGMYVWKWPSCSERIEAYCPRGRPAADFLAGVFRGKSSTGTSSQGVTRKLDTPRDR